MTRPLIDIHPHVISSDETRYPKQPLGGVQSTWSQERPADWPALEAAMDDAGVTKAAVVQSSTTYGHDNSYLADSVDASGGRIAGVCSAGFMDDDVLERIRYWIDERGMSGLRLFTTGSTMGQADWLDDPKTKKAWAHVAENGIPMCVQLRESALPQLAGLLREFPDLVVIVDHAAMIDFTVGPPYAAADPVYRLADFPGVNIKLTSRVLRFAERSEGGPAGVVRELVDHFGSDRIAWGSNWPANEGTLASLVDLLARATEGLDEADVDNIHSRTAARLYPALA